MRLTEKTKYLPCRDETYREAFFVSNIMNGQEDSAANVEAKTLCAHCPILQECRAEGIRISDRWAVMGGLSPADRDAINQENDNNGLELAA